jgi:hypothetical protein
MRGSEVRILSAAPPLSHSEYPEVAGHHQGTTARPAPGLNKGRATPEPITMTTNAKAECLGEHLPFELKMLRYSFSMLLQENNYLSWNAHLDSFAVHGRNLANLLTNGDAGNFQAKDFALHYRTRIGDLSGPMSKLNEQVMHLGKKRTAETSGKFNTDNARAILDWIEKNFTDFLEAMPAADRRLFDVEKSQHAVPTKFTLPGLPNQTASSAAPIVVSSEVGAWVK